MIKTTMCIRRKSDISREAFFNYWNTQHADLIKRLQLDLKIVKYVQSHSLDNPVSTALRAARNGPEMFDGVGEAWFESIESLYSLGSDERSAQALKLLLEDEFNFIDLANSPFWVAEEKQIF